MAWLNALRLTFVFVLITLCGCQPLDEKGGIQQPLSEGGQRGLTVTPAIRVRFPDDHGSHDAFAVEWWYLTANLSDAAGNVYPMQWTLFRFLGESAQAPWANQQQYMVHGKLNSEDKHWFEERFARGGVGNAGVTHNPFSAYLDDWVWQSETADLFPSQLMFRFEDTTTVALTLRHTGPYILHGQQGYSRKLRHGDQASMYYSQPFIEVDGDLVIDGETISVSGPGWFDHEWTSQYLQQDTLGWDWFSLHLDDGSKVMLFNMRHSGAEDFWSGSHIQADGTKTHLSEQDIRARIVKRETVANRTLPLEWEFELVTQNLRFSTRPIKPDQWNDGIFSYYEGAIIVEGEQAGAGFMELTGY